MRSSEAERQVVAQVVETEFVVGAVGDVAGVGGALLVGRLAALDHADRQAEEAVDRPHPVRVALRQVVVDRDHVHALAWQRVQVRRQRRDQRLAFAGAHLGDLALVQHHAADQLHVEVAHAERAARRLADSREGFGQHVVEGLAVGEPLAEFRGLALELLVAQRFERLFERIGAGDALVIAVQKPLITAAEQLGKPIGHVSELRRGGEKGGYCKALGPGRHSRVKVEAAAPKARYPVVFLRVC